ncbi:cytochrome B [Chitinophaga tropicalis]|uniref:Cytochrome B n=1 Tax=Chitinophaga tropicalis TaxID=2683588 RepID=A0A7K1U8W6_9BACT|nr:cytochrome B [Chitinophaga tropicalis]MVT10766.1 cytochrome B [Chitinophaga tropicalis]
MHNTLLIIHSLLRWAILLAGIWAVLRAFKGVSGKTAFTGADNKAGLFFMIFFDLQLLVGLLLYFVSPTVQTALGDMKAAMKDGILRFYAVEHITMGIIAFVLVHIGRSKVKKATTDALKHKKALIFFGITLILVLLLTPWPFREAGRSLLW